MNFTLETNPRRGSLRLACLSPARPSEAETSEFTCLMRTGMDRSATVTDRGARSESLTTKESTARARSGMASVALVCRLADPYWAYKLRIDGRWSPTGRSLARGALRGPCATKARCVRDSSKHLIRVEVAGDGHGHVYQSFVRHTTLVLWATKASSRSRQYLQKWVPTVLWLRERCRLSLRTAARRACKYGFVRQPRMRVNPQQVRVDERVR